MPFTDRQAARRIRELREDRGYSQDGFAKALRRRALAGGWPPEIGTVDAFTIRAIEDHDHVPSLRVQVALSLFLEVSRTDLWERDNRVPIAEPIRQRVRPPKQKAAA